MSAQGKERFECREAGTRVTGAPTKAQPWAPRRTQRPGSCPHPAEPHLLGRQAENNYRVTGMNSEGNDDGFPHKEGNQHNLPPNQQ